MLLQKCSSLEHRFHVQIYVNIYEDKHINSENLRRCDIGQHRELHTRLYYCKTLPTHEIGKWAAVRLKNI